MTPHTYNNTHWHNTRMHTVVPAARSHGHFNTHVRNTDDFKKYEYEYGKLVSTVFSSNFPSNSIMHNTIQTLECKPAVPKHATPLAADIFESTSMSQTFFASDSLSVAAYFLG